MKSGLLDKDDGCFTSQASMLPHTFREHTTSSLQRVSLKQLQQTLSTQSAHGARPLTSRRASLLISESPQPLRPSSRATRRITEINPPSLDQQQSWGAGINGRRVTGSSGSVGLSPSPFAQAASRRLTEQDGPSPITRRSSGNMLLPKDEDDDDEDCDGLTRTQSGGSRNSFLQLTNSSQLLKSMTDAIAGLSSGKAKTMPRRQTDDSVQQQVTPQIFTPLLSRRQTVDLAQVSDDVSMYMDSLTG